MQRSDVRLNKGILVIIVIAILVLVLLLVGYWTRAAYREAQIAASLTPELVVKAFQDAGFETNDVRGMDYYPGPMPPGQYGTRFSIETSDEIVHVFVVLYNSNEEARKAAIAINELNRQMGGTYGYAFHRGPILLDVAAYNEQVARELYAVLKAIE